MMQRRLREICGLGAFCALVFFANISFAGDVLVERREKLETQITQFADKVHEVNAKSNEERIALIDFRAQKKSPENDKVAEQLTMTFEKQLLRRGVMIRRYELDHKFEVSYKNKRLPSRWFDKAQLESVKSANNRMVLTGTVSSSRDKHKLVLSLIDLNTFKYAILAIKFTIDARKLKLTELLNFDELPAMNDAILRYSIKMLGKKVDRGECWDLPAVPMKQNGVKIYTYTFGETVTWDKAMPGDVITFGDSGKTGGHVIVLLRHATSYSKALIMHQNWAKKRFIMVAKLSEIIRGKKGQKMRVQRPKPKP